MADKRKPGYCTYCESRVWATRGNHFWTKWACASCGSPIRYVGEPSVQHALALRRQELTERTIQHDPEATMGGAPISDLSGRDPIFGTLGPRRDTRI